ncbi:MAG: GFA family protein [Burkholderiaceae bacterium]|nr:GFA family protein [Burkholderiaceae bacterium]
MSEPTDSVLTGGCLCGAVAYRSGAPIRPPSICHCTSCRRAAGAHAVAWFTAPTAQFAFTRGAPATFRSSPPVVRSFCASCGTPLTYRHDDSPHEVDVTIGSLDDPSRVAPVAHTWMEDAASWDRPGDGRPQFAQSRAHAGD